MRDIQLLRKRCDNYYGFDRRVIACGGARTFVNIDKNDKALSVNFTTKLALDFYNRENQTNFNVVKVCKLNIFSVYQYITLWAHDDVSHKSHLFRCALNLVKRKVLLCEIKYYGEISTLVGHVDDYFQKLGESDEGHPLDTCKNLGDGSAPGSDGVILVSPTMFCVMGEKSSSDLHKMCDDFLDPCLYEVCGRMTLVDIKCCDWVTEYANLAINFYNQREQQNFILIKVEKVYYISASNHHCMTFWALNGRIEECRLFRAVCFKGYDEENDKTTSQSKQDDDSDQELNESEEDHPPHACDKDRALDDWGVDAATNSTLERSVDAQDVETVHYNSWTQQMDDFLLDFLLDQKNQGQKLDSDFSQATYSAFVEAINFKFSMEVNKDEFQNRLKMLKRKMTIILEVFKRDIGFGWNDITKQIDAPDEVWDALIKVYPDAKHVRHIAIPPMFREMVEKDRTIGKGAETAKEKKRRWTKEGKESSGRESSKIEENENFDSLNDTISHVAKAMDVNEQSKRRCQEVYSELTKLDGVDENFIFAAYDFLVLNPTAAEGFLGIPPDVRFRWLSWKMHHSIK